MRFLSVSSTKAPGEIYHFRPATREGRKSGATVEASCAQGRKQVGSKCQRLCHLQTECQLIIIWNENFLLWKLHFQFDFFGKTTKGTRMNNFKFLEIILKNMGKKSLWWVIKCNWKIMQALHGFSQVTTLTDDWQSFYQITFKIKVYFIILNNNEWIKCRTSRFCKIRCVQSESMQEEKPFQDLPFLNIVLTEKSNFELNPWVSQV